MHCCPLPLDDQGDKAPGAGEDGTQDPGDSPAGDSRRVTPLACIHRPVKPLDGRMVVANPYLPMSHKLNDTSALSLLICPILGDLSMLNPTLSGILMGVTL